MNENVKEAYKIASSIIEDIEEGTCTYDVDDLISAIEDIKGYIEDSMV